MIEGEGDVLGCESARPQPSAAAPCCWSERMKSSVSGRITRGSADSYYRRAGPGFGHAGDQGMEARWLDGNVRSIPLCLPSC